MAAPPPLSDEEVHAIREFFTSPAAKHVFEVVEYGYHQDWANQMDPAARERIWTDLKALLRLIVTLRDVEGMKRLDARSQARTMEV